MGRRHKAAAVLLPPALLLAAFSAYSLYVQAQFHSQRDGLGKGDGNQVQVLSWPPGANITFLLSSTAPPPGVSPCNISTTIAGGSDHYHLKGALVQAAFADGTSVEEVYSGDSGEICLVENPLARHWALTLLTLLTWLALTVAALRPRVPPELVATAGGAPDAERLEVGGGFADYRLISLLGAGAMGQVYKAVRQSTGETVAVKVLAEQAEAEQDSVGRFQREWEISSRFHHPNVVGFSASGTVQQRPYLVMEYVSGGTLRQRLEQGPLELREVLVLANDIAQGLAYAHAQGTQHRDIKPENILLDDQGRARIADFGLARAHDSKTLTATGTILGTPAYMAPDQIQESNPGPQSDLYSLGVVFYEMIDGRTPFPTHDLMTLLTAHIMEAPPPLRRPDLPPALVDLIGRLLAKKPSQRPSAAALVEELATLLNTAVV